MNGPGRLQAILEDERWRPSLAATLLLVALLSFAAGTPLWRSGDASEYILTTESLWFDRDLTYDEKDLTRHLALKPAVFDTPAGLVTPVGSNGKRFLGTWHSFYYSLAAVPFYAVLSYRGFYVLNALLLFAAMMSLRSHLARFNPDATAWLWTLGAVFLSASLSYVAWIHTEVFHLALAAFFMRFWRAGRPVAAAAFLGLASGSQPIFAAVWLPFLAAELWSSRRLRHVLACGIVGAVFASPQFLVNLTLLGVPSAMTATGDVGAKFMSIGKLARTLIDPAAGLIWFYPAVIASVAFAPRTLRTLLTVLGAVLLLLASTASVAWYSDGVGIRYCAYVFPLFLFLPDEVSFVGRKALLVWVWTAFCGAGLVLNALGNSPSLDVGRKLYLPYRIARLLPFYREESTILWFRCVHVREDVGIDPGWQDGWTAGGEDVTVVVMNAPRGAPAVNLVLDPWFGMKGSRQPLSVRTESGTRFEHGLTPGSTNEVRIPLTAGDVRFGDGGGGAVGVLVLKLRAGRWTALESLPGSTDTRSLGVRVAGITWARN